MAEQRTITIPWDPAEIEPALRRFVSPAISRASRRAARPGPTGGADREIREARLIELYKLGTGPLTSDGPHSVGLRWSRFWYVLHGLFSTRVSRPPAWVADAPPDDLIRLLSDSLRHGIIAGIDAFLAELPRNYPTVRRHLTKARSKIAAGKFEIEYRDLDRIDFLHWVLSGSKTTHSYRSDELADPKMGTSLSGTAFRAMLDAAYRTFAEQIPAIEFAPKTPQAAVHADVAEEELTSYDTSIAGASSAALWSLIQTDALPLPTRYEAALEFASRGHDATLELCDYLVAVLRDAPATQPWTHACVGLSEDIQLTDPLRRRALAAGLMRIATALHSTPQREIAWVAIRRWATLAAIDEFGSLALFLAPGTEVETMQCAAQCMWNRLALEPTPPLLPTLERRCAELLSKSIDVDWLSFPFAGSLTANLLLAYATLASDADLAAVATRARALDADYFPWQLIRSKTRRMHEHVRAHALPSACVDRILALLP